MTAEEILEETKRVYGEDFEWSDIPAFARKEIQNLKGFWMRGKLSNEEYQDRAINAIVEGLRQREYERREEQRLRWGERV